MTAGLMFIVSMVGFFVMIYMESGVNGLITIAILIAIIMLLSSRRSVHK